jgi:hypothetical protein
MPSSSVLSVLGALRALSRLRVEFLRALPPCTTAVPVSFVWAKETSLWPAASVVLVPWIAPMPIDDLWFDLPESAIKDLLVLADSADRLPAVIAAASTIGPQTGVKAVARVVSKEVGMTAAELRTILLPLLNYHATRTRLKVSPAEMADLVTGVLRRSTSAEAESRLNRWESARAKVVGAAEQLNDDHPLAVAAKSLRIVSAHQFDLAEIRILTDVRPVFNQAGDKIVQSIISHILSIDYHDGRGHHVIQFSLDGEDVAQLKESCERAARKAAIVKHDLKTAPWPVSVFRDPTENEISSK